MTVACYYDSLLFTEKNSLADGEEADTVKPAVPTNLERRKLFPGFENLQHRNIQNLKASTKRDTTPKEEVHIQPAQKLESKAAVTTDTDVEVVEYRQGWLMPDHKDQHQS